MKHLPSVLVLALLALGCDSTPPKVPDSFEENKCPDACAQLSKLGCPEGKPSRKGITCTEVCFNTLRNGVDLHPGCVANSGTCEIARLCSK